MANYVTTLERKDLTSISSFQKALAIIINEHTKDNKLYLATIQDNKVDITDWTDDEQNLITNVTSFYGTITHINITTNNVYTAITPYILSDKISDSLIVLVPKNLSLEQTYTFAEFKSSVIETHKVLSLVSLYEKHKDISNNKEKYSNAIDALTSAINNSKAPLKGLVPVTILPHEVQVSFTTDIERFVSSMFSNCDDLEITKMNPLNFISKSNNPFNKFIFGLKSESKENYGHSGSLTVREFLQLYNNGDLEILVSDTNAIDTTPHIVGILQQHTKEFNVRVSSNPLG